ncbi:MAG: MFS transporter [Deltaproteobacteria bacterium]|nr:MFS transporter [Deltaproteobacteria bacterium]
MSHSERRGSIWTPTFALLCLAQFLGYAAHHMLTPAFPLYVTRLGGSAFMVGLVLASFAVTSVFLRPPIGYWADRWNEAGVLICGLLVQGASIFLCFVPAIEAAMLANALRGIGWAGMNTGGYSLLAWTAPVDRRGEASGYYSGVQSSATILFPAVALWLIDARLGGFGAVFAAAAALAFLGAGAGAALARSAPRAAARPEAVSPGPRGAGVFVLLERDVLPATTMLFCLHLSLPAVTSFLVLYAREIGIGNFGWYFVVSGATSVLARPLLGVVSDRIGRARSLAAGFALQAAALILVVAASGLAGLLISGVFYMLGSAIGSSATLALAMERADPRRRGRAMATLSVAFPASTGIGALLTGGAVELAGYFWMFLIVAGLAALGLALTLASRSSLK